MFARGPVYGWRAEDGQDRFLTAAEGVRVQSINNVRKIRRCIPYGLMNESGRKETRVQLLPSICQPFNAHFVEIRRPHIKNGVGPGQNKSGKQQPYQSGGQ